MIQTVLFDLDGTLADTAPELAATTNQLLREQGMTEIAYDVLRAEVSFGAAALIKCAFGKEEQEIPNFSQLRERFLEIYHENLGQQTELFPGMAELLEALEAREIRWGIVTNKPSWLTDPLLKVMKLNRRAACIVSGDTAGYPKPHPAPMIYASDRAGVPPECCLYVGDAKTDVQAAHGVGMRCLVVNWGYFAKDTDLQSWGADSVISRASQVLNHIGG